MREYTDYADYTADEFLADDGFRAWALGDRAEAPFWEGLVVAYPDREPEVATARALLRELETEAGRHRLTAAEVRARLRPLQRLVAERAARRRRWRRQALAAAAMLLAVVAAARWLLSGGRAGAVETYATTFGETREVRLPDGSTVTLNAGSELRVPAQDWGAGERRVWLRGEAFFAVAKAGEPGRRRRFIVETEGEEAYVEVLGTEFNVNTRFGHTDVLLREGSVRLHTELETVELVPGDHVVYDEAAGRIERTSAARIDDELAWMRGMMRFESQPLAEVVRELEAITGTAIEIANPDLATVTLSLTVDTTDVAEFFEILRAIEGDRLTIERVGEGYRIR